MMTNAAENDNEQGGDPILCPRCEDDESAEHNGYGEIDAHACRVDGPVDSDDHPVAVLIQNNYDADASSCDQCGRAARAWSRTGGYGIPGAMYRANLYCADCASVSYDGVSGALVRTLTGDPV